MPGALRYRIWFENRADLVLGGNPSNYRLAEPMLDAVSFASGLRVAPLSACDEGNAAREAAADGARAIERLTGSIGLADVTRPALADSEAAPGTVDWTVALAAANAPLAALERRVSSRVTGLRQRVQKGERLHLSCWKKVGRGYLTTLRQSTRHGPSIPTETIPPHMRMACSQTVAHG